VVKNNIYDYWYHKQSLDSICDNMNTMHILQDQLMQLTNEQSALTSKVEPIYRGQYLEQRAVSIITMWLLY